MVRYVDRNPGQGLYDRQGTARGDPEEAQRKAHSGEFEEAPSSTRQAPYHPDASFLVNRVVPAQMAPPVRGPGTIPRRAHFLNTQLDMILGLAPRNRASRTKEKRGRSARASRPLVDCFPGLWISRAAGAQETRSAPGPRPRMNQPSGRAPGVRWYTI